MSVFSVSLAGVYHHEYQTSLEFLGVEYVAAVLRRAGYPVVIREIPYTKEGGFGQELDEILAQKPNAVGLTSFLTDFKLLEMAVREVKDRLPEAFLFLGGPFPTVFTGEVLANLPEVDAVVVGEGEYTTLELIRRLERGESLEGLEGLWFRQQGEIVTNLRRKPIEMLDDLPFPVRDFLPGKTHAVISSSRGCLGRCTFCNERSLLNYGGRIWRGRRPERVVDEMESIVKEYGINDFVFSDSSFEDPGRLGLQRIRQIAELILERDLRIYFTCYMRAETMKESELELLHLLHRAGMSSVFTGVEAGSKMMLELFGKKATVEDNEASIQLFKQTQIYQRIGFIMFTPETTLMDVEENLNFLIRTGFCYDLQKVKSILGVYQTSPLYERFCAKGLVKPFISYQSPASYQYLDSRVELIYILFSQLKDVTPYELLHECESLLSKSCVRYPENEGLQAFQRVVNRIKSDLNKDYSAIVLQVLDIVKQADLGTNLQQNLRVVFAPIKEVQQQLARLNEHVIKIHAELEEARRTYLHLNHSKEEFWNDLVKKQHHGVLQAIDRTKKL